MDIWEVVSTRRSIRAFKQDPLDENLLKRMVDAARLAPSEANVQPLKYLLVTQKDLLPQLYQHLKWAAYLAPYGAPPEGKGPTAYIVVLVDVRIKDSGYSRGLGAAVENTLLAGQAHGVASCWIASVNTKAVAELFKIPEHLKVDSVVALGYPDETAVVEPMTDSVKYWRDQNGLHHVPKRDLAEILFINSIEY